MKKNLNILVCSTVHAKTSGNVTQYRLRLIRSHDKAWKTGIQLVRTIPMVLFSVSYILSSGRSHEQSEHVLSVEVDWDDQPKEFFLAIKKLMRSQCEQWVTTQFQMVTLCPVYKITDMNSQFAMFSYRKFSDKFLEEVAKLRDPQFTSHDDGD